MNRRDFLQWLFCLAGSFALINVHDFLGEPANTIADGLSVPAALSDKVFWGYKPVHFESVEQHLSPHHNAVALSYIQALQTDPLHTALWCEKTSLGNGKTLINVGLKDLTAQQKITAEHIEAGLKDAANKLVRYAYNERLLAVADMLLPYFRAFAYKLRKGDTVVPHTLAETALLKEGNCIDAALGRYTIAKALGVKPEHMMIVLYVSRTPGKDSHANFALFHPGRNAWLIIDGTGRQEGQKLGGAILYENEGTNFNRMTDEQDLVPVAAVYAGGVCGFDSITSFDEKNETWTFSPPHPMLGKKMPFLKVYDADTHRPKIPALAAIPNGRAHLTVLNAA